MIPHSRPLIDQKDCNAVLRVLKSGNLVQGKKVEEYESLLSSMIGVKYGAAVNSGTAALHLALLSLGIKKGDEVILPSIVCSAPLNAIFYTGATPVIADIDRRTFNVDIHDLKKRITRKTKAIILPHMFGLPADIDTVKSLGLSIIEDCAHSVGGRYKGQYVGHFGDLSIFSFYTTKMIASGEGGMVCSNNRKLIGCVKDLRSYDEKAVYKIRYNYKMTDLQAALGISQLKKLSSFIKRRRAIARIYDHEFQSCRFEIPSDTSDNNHVYFRYVILMDHVDRFIEKMRTEGVICRRPVFKPLHKYLGLSGYAGSDWVWKRAVSLPLYPSLTDKEICKVTEAVRQST
jgi:perosamine synthetase